jgi:hypothetical protein
VWLLIRSIAGRVWRGTRIVFLNFGKLIVIVARGLVAGLKRGGLILMRGLRAIGLLVRRYGLVVIAFVRSFSRRIRSDLATHRENIAQSECFSRDRSLHRSENAAQQIRSIDQSA